MTQDYTQPDGLKIVPTQTTGSDLGLRCAVASGSALLEAAKRYGRREMRHEDYAEISRARKWLYRNEISENDGDVACRVLVAELDRALAALAAVHEWYIRDGSVGGCSDMIDEHVMPFLPPPNVKDQPRP